PYGGSVPARRTSQHASPRGLRGGGTSGVWRRLARLREIRQELPSRQFRRERLFLSPLRSAIARTADCARERARRGIRQRAALPAHERARDQARERDLLQPAHLLEYQPFTDRAARLRAGERLARDADPRPARRARAAARTLSLRRLRRRRCEWQH